MKTFHLGKISIALCELFEFFFLMIAIGLLTLIFPLLERSVGLRQEASVGSDSENYRKSSQSRLLCFVITAIAKLATYHRELLPRARVSLGKVCLLLLIVVCYDFPFEKKKLHVHTRCETQERRLHIRNCCHTIRTH